jgi:hypothetical protein
MVEAQNFVSKQPFHRLIACRKPVAAAAHGSTGFIFFHPPSTGTIIHRPTADGRMSPFSRTFVDGDDGGGGVGQTTKDEKKI